MGGFDPSTLAAGLTTVLSEFASAYGPIVLTVAGAGLGLYGVGFVISYVKRHVRAKETAKN